MKPLTSNSGTDTISKTKYFVETMLLLDIKSKKNGNYHNQKS